MYNELFVWADYQEFLLFLVDKTKLPTLIITHYSVTVIVRTT